jgi:hypothetical protein
VFGAGLAARTRDARHSEGNYQGYIEDLKRRSGPDAHQPHRVQYQKLVRAQLRQTGVASSQSNAPGTS